MFGLATIKRMNELAAGKAVKRTERPAPVLPTSHKRTRTRPMLDASGNRWAPRYNRGTFAGYAMVEEAPASRMRPGLTRAMNELRRLLGESRDDVRSNDADSAYVNGRIAALTEAISALRAIGADAPTQRSRH